MKLKIGVMGSATGLLSSAQRQLAYELGRAIAENDCVTITGACPGLPLESARGAKAAGGLVVGISPALSEGEHICKYVSPVECHDVLIFTGSGLMGREVVNIRSSDIVVIIGGRSGTLGEFSIAYDEGKLIGVLLGTGGITSQIKEIVRIVRKKTGARLIYDRDPQQLIKRLIVYFKRAHYKHPSVHQNPGPMQPNADQCGIMIREYPRGVTISQVTGSRPPHVRNGDPLGLMEKYLHSQGAALYDEARFDEAISFLERAIALDDQPYTRYHLCLASLEKKDFDRALRELNRAIELNPFVAKYYHRRSWIWESKGDRARADEDYAKAISLDANYARVQQIRSSYDIVERALSDTEMIEWCRTARPRSGEINNLVREFEKSSGELSRLLGSVSCSLPCPAYCCHFSGETIRHGVHIGAWKLSAIQNFLREKGLPEGDFLGKMRFTRQEHFVRLIPPNYVIKEHNQEFVYYPTRGNKRLDEALLKHLPKGKEYQDLLWINEESRACAFLREGRCMIHDVGGEPSLPACKEFLCMTGFVFAALGHLGLIEESQFRFRSMAQLNQLAVEALLILAETLYNKPLMRLRSEKSDALKKAVEFDASGDSGEAIRCITEYRRLADEHENLFATQRELTGQAIKTVFGD